MSFQILWVGYCGWSWGLGEGGVPLLGLSASNPLVGFMMLVLLFALLWIFDRVLHYEDIRLVSNWCECVPMKIVASLHFGVIALLLKYPMASKECVTSLAVEPLISACLSLGYGPIIMLYLTIPSVFIFPLPCLIPSNFPPLYAYHSNLPTL